MGGIASTFWRTVGAPDRVPPLKTRQDTSLFCRKAVVAARQRALGVLCRRGAGLGNTPGVFERAKRAIRNRLVPGGERVRQET